MARGKQAAKAANRRALNAQAKTDEVKNRLKKEREDTTKTIQDLRDEVARLKSSHRAEAERLAAEEVASLREQMAELSRHRAATLELVRQASQSKEYLIFNACRYISMTKGISPNEAFGMVTTWLTGEDFIAVRDVDTFLSENMLPTDGWIAKNLRRDAHWENVLSNSTQAVGAAAMSLDSAEERGHEDIHPDYRAHWYESRPQQPRRGTKPRVTTVAQVRAVVPQRKK